MQSSIVFASSSSAVPPRPPQRPLPSTSDVIAKPLPIPQEKKELEDPRRRALLGAAFSALASAGIARETLAATATPSNPITSTPPAGWSYASKGKDWSSLGFDSCGATGQQSPINLSPPFSRIGRTRREDRAPGRGEQRQREQPPFLELSADYRSAAFDVVVERGVTASPKFTVVATGKKKRGGAAREDNQQPQQEQRHPAGGIYLLHGETNEKVFYPLVQFHFHRPGEEALEGKRGALGAHLVHQRDEESPSSSILSSESSPSISEFLPRFVVVAVAFDLSRTSRDAALDDLFSAEDGEEGEEREGAPPRRIEAFDPSRLLPASLLPAAPPSLPSPRKLGNFFAFEGSLTTPPCTLAARFYLAKGRKAATPEQISGAVLPRGTARNARPLQERGARVVWEG